MAYRRHRVKRTPHPTIRHLYNKEALRTQSEELTRKPLYVRKTVKPLPVMSLLIKYGPAALVAAVLIYLLQLYL